MKTNKKGNLIVAVFCLLVGLALVGTGIYYLADGKSTMTGGVIFALGLVICAMFVVTCVMMKKVDKMKADADARYTIEQERQYRAVKEMLDRIRAADGKLSQEEIAAIVAEAKARAMSDEPFPDEETPSAEGAPEATPADGDTGNDDAADGGTAPEYDRAKVGGGLPEGASPYGAADDGETPSETPAESGESGADDGDGACDVKPADDGE